MRAPRSLISCLLACVYFCCPTAMATTCVDIEDQHARDCCERNQPQSSMTQTVRMTVADERGTVSNLGGALAWKRFDDGRARARITLTDPPRQSGTVVLLTERESDDPDAPLEPEAVLYKPSERRDRLITIGALSGEMFGTDFSYEDVAQFYGTNAQNVITRLPDGEVDGQAVIVLESKPADPDAAYDRGSVYNRVVTYFDAARCVPLRTEFFEDDELRKALVANPESIREIDARWIPFELTMHDHFEDSRTILHIDSIEFDPPLRASLFSRSSLKRGR